MGKIKFHGSKPPTRLYDYAWDAPPTILRAFIEFKRCHIGASCHSRWLTWIPKVGGMFINTSGKPRVDWG